MPFVQPPEVLFADETNRPVFRMGPYDNEAMTANFRLVAANRPAPAIDWAAHLGQAPSFLLTKSGREAIDLAIGDLGLDSDDEVLIETTSGSPYISRCVTDHISRCCRWSQRRSARTRAVFVIHEFGFPARLSSELIASGLPVIEDCAYAYGSQNEEGSVGRLGDYVIYSFSKAMPVPYGGLLKSRPRPAGSSGLSAAAARELPLLLAHYLPGLPAAYARRRAIFEEYRRRFSDEGWQPLFEPGPAVVPHAFVLSMPDQRQAEAIKPRLTAAGILSSVFYRGGGYYLPNHQSLSPAAVDYIVANVVAALRDL